MSEKLRKFRSTCSTIGIAAGSVYIMMGIGGSVRALLVARVIASIIAVTAYAVRCGGEIMSDEKSGNSILCMVLWFFCLVITALQLV